jgi:hypothetical protein
VIKSPQLTGIESNEIAIMALVRFGGPNGRFHQITGAFPLPKSNLFELRVRVHIKPISIVVRAPNVDASFRKARAQLARDAKTIDAMILSSAFAKELESGKYKVDLSYYTGKFPSPRSPR